MGETNTSEQHDNPEETSRASGAGLGLDPDAAPDERTVAQIEEEREHRLDPDNRPEGAEVDNTQRDFDVERGRFTDSAAYDDSEPAPFSDPEDPNNPDNEVGSADEPDAPGDEPSTRTERQEAP